MSVISYLRIRLFLSCHAVDEFLHKLSKSIPNYNVLHSHDVDLNLVVLGTYDLARLVGVVRTRDAVAADGALLSEFLQSREVQLL